MRALFRPWFDSLFSTTLMLGHPAVAGGGGGVLRGGGGDTVRGGQTVVRACILGPIPVFCQFNVGRVLVLTDPLPRPAVYMLQRLCAATP